MFFLPLCKVYKRQHGNFTLFVNYRGGETLEVRGVGSENLDGKFSVLRQSTFVSPLEKVVAMKF
jgi:hypothetical protein